MKIMKMSCKCSDMFNASLDGKDYDGYVPEWLPSPNTEHWGDYVMLDIDVETGQIVNWKKPTQEQLDETFKGEDSEEE